MPWAVEEPASSDDARKQGYRMRHIICDECGRTMRPNDPGGVHLVAVCDEAREAGDPRDADMCSVACLRDWIAHEYPAQQPDFAAAHAPLGGRITADEWSALDEAAS